jgi:hypothetical protein
LKNGTINGKANHPQLEMLVDHLMVAVDLLGVEMMGLQEVVEVVF